MLSEQELIDIVPPFLEHKNSYTYISKVTEISLKTLHRKLPRLVDENDIPVFKESEYEQIRTGYERYKQDLKNGDVVPYLIRKYIIQDYLLNDDISDSELSRATGIPRRTISGNRKTIKEKHQPQRIPDSTWVRYRKALYDEDLIPRGVLDE